MFKNRNWWDAKSRVHAAVDGGLGSIENEIDLTGTGGLKLHGANLTFASDGGDGGGAGGEGGEGGDGGDGGAGDLDAAALKAELAKIQKEKADLLKETMRRKDEGKTLKEQLDSIQGVLGDLKPEDVKTLLDEKAAAEREKLESKGEYDKVVAQMNEQRDAREKELKDQLGERDQKLTSMQSQIEELTVGRAFNDSGYISESTTLTPSIARQVFGSHFDIVDGKTVGFDAPRGTEGRAQLVDGSGVPLSFDAALGKMVSSHPDSKSLLRSKMKPGAGSGSDGAGGKGTGQNQDPGTGINRIRFALAEQSGSK